MLIILILDVRNPLAPVTVNTDARTARIVGAPAVHRSFSGDINHLRVDLFKLSHR